MMPNQDQPRHERYGASPTARSVWDAATGREWRVWMADCRDVPGARSDRCLIFDCGTTVRRVWGPPDDWASMPDDRLLALADRGQDR